MTTYSIPPNYLKAAMTHSAVNGSRACLNGIHIRVHNSMMYIVATDGGRAFIGRYHMPDGTLLHITIPFDTIKLVTKIKSHFYDLTILDGRFSIADINFIPIDEKFPDINRIIPKTLSGETAQYNPQYLLDAHESLKKWHSPGCFFHMKHNGSGAGVMSGSDAFVIIMPWVATSKNSTTDNTTFQVEGD